MPFRARASPSNLIRHRQNALILRKQLSTSAISPRIKATPFHHRTDISTPAAGPSRTATRSISLGSIQESLFPNLSRAWQARSGQPSTSTLKVDKAVADFRRGIARGDVVGITKGYEGVLQAIMDDGSAERRERYLTSQHLVEAMEALAKRGSEGVKLLRRIYRDTTTVFGYELTSHHHRALVRGLCRAELPRDAFQLAQKLDGEDIGWTTILASALKSDSSLFDPVISFIKSHRPLNVEDYVLLLRRIRKLRDKSVESTREALRADMKGILREMGERGLGLGRPGEAELLRLHVSFGDMDRARELKDGLESVPDERRFRGGFAALMIYRIAMDDEEGVVGLCRRMKGVGMEPLSRGLIWLVERRLRVSGAEGEVRGVERIMEVVEDVERETHAEVDSSVWSAVIWRTIFGGLTYSDPTAVRSNDQLDMAMAVYTRARAQGVITDLRLANELIYPSCHAGPSRLRDALEVYNDYMATDPSFLDHRTRLAVSDMYKLLLKTCAKSSEDGALPAAIQLLDEMRDRDLFFTQDHLASLIIRLMRSAPDHASAFQIYSQFIRLQVVNLGSEDHQAILSAFISMMSKRSPFAPAEMCLEMIKDMYRSGHRPGTHVLTSILHSYGKMATRTHKAKGSTEPILASIREIHTRTRLDPMIIIDIPLLNALMDAYNRSAAYTDAFEVWAELVGRRSREPKETVVNAYAASINIILDTCGHGQFPERGQKIWRWAKKWELVPDRKRWDAYLEAMCRWGQVDDALKVVVDEMKGGMDGAPKPGKETLELLLKFAWKDDGDFKEVVSTLQREFPEMWEEVKWVVETKK